jgi:hypothetical protein
MIVAAWAINPLMSRVAPGFFGSAFALGEPFTLVAVGLSAVKGHLGAAAVLALAFVALDLARRSSSTRETEMGPMRFGATVGWA